jgi:glycosyltransferase involved in cell wall biosynthesis
MLKGHDIICFSSDWRQDPLSKHHIMSRLAKENRVLWINSIGMRNPTVSKKDLAKAVKKIGGYLGNRLEPVDKNFWVLSPMVLPFHGNRLANRINDRWLLRQVRGCQKKLGFGDPILWSFLPNAVGVFGQLGEKLAVYYITDDFTKFTGHPAGAIGRMEKELVAKADVIIASSRHLADIKGNGKKINFVSHGVNHAHFSRALGITAEQYPADIRNIKKPIIGFYGEINDWLDLKMIHRAAGLKPDWSFVLLGRVAVEAGDIGYLKTLPNIHLLGQKKFDQLPAYCAAFDVGLIPMKLNDLTVCVHPLKLKEYLAAGLPVVSARLPEVLAYKDVVEFADNAEELIAAVTKHLTGDREKIKHALSRRVAAENWDDKVVEISVLIEKALNERTYA